MEKPSVRNRFKTPEGRYFLQSEKVTGLVPFNSNRCTRLTYATLTGGPEEGPWIICNIGDYLHLCRPDATDKEPTRSILFNNSPVRTGYPTCHAFLTSKDGQDLVVGLGDGEVVVMSLRAQLQAPALSGKPIITSTHSPDGQPESIRCTAVAWLPRNDGSFIAAYSTGVLQVFRKAGSASTDGKFSLSISSNKNNNPVTVFQPGGGPISDMAVSPDGSKVAVACRDGVCRLLDTSSGAVVGGFQSYYGAVLCCCWSPDGRYVACGGEDDLVAVYGLAEKYCVQYGDGHTSWVSRVAFDPWQPNAVLSTPLPELVNGRIYRLGSTGQDGMLCLWDLSLCQDLPEPYALLPLGRGGPASPLPSPGTGHSRNQSGDHTSSSGKAGKGSAASVTNGAATLAPSLPRAEMAVQQAVMAHKVHAEPISDVLFAEHQIFTADHSGQIKAWLRPSGGGSDKGDHSGEHTAMMDSPHK